MEEKRQLKHMDNMAEMKRKILEKEAKKQINDQIRQNKIENVNWQYEQKQKEKIESKEKRQYEKLTNIMDERAKAQQKQEHNLLIKMENQIRKEKLRKDQLNARIAKAKKMGDLSQIKEFKKQYEDEFDH